MVGMWWVRWLVTECSCVSSLLWWVRWLVTECPCVNSLLCCVALVTPQQNIDVATLLMWMACMLRELVQWG